MNIPKSIEDVKYNLPYYWDVSINPLATVDNGLGNCTTLVLGAVLSAKMPLPISVLTDAKNWHTVLINGWYCVPYSEHKNNIKEGDILEWVGGNHVAIVSGTGNEIMISGSFYTGIHGKAYYNGSYDTRNGISSLKQLNDFMVDKYPYRFFHYVSLEEENKWCGSEPDYVLVAPISIVPVEKNKSKNQVYVGTNGLRVRSEPNTNSNVNGQAMIGYYNVDETIEQKDYIWYKIGNYYIAGVDGVIYYPKVEIVPMEQMMNLMKQMEETYLSVCNDRDLYKEKLERIRGILDE